MAKYILAVSAALPPDLLVEHISDAHIKVDHIDNLKEKLHSREWNKELESLRQLLNALHRRNTEGGHPQD